MKKHKPKTIKLLHLLHKVNLTLGDKSIPPEARAVVMQTIIPLLVRCGIYEGHEINEEGLAKINIPQHLR